MSNSNNIKNSIVKRAGLIAGALALSIGVVALTYNKTNDNDNEEKALIKYNDYYNGNQASISTPSIPTSDSNTISISDVVNSSNYENVYITISSAEELTMFSNLLNNSTYGEKFSGQYYKYKLISNIDYNDYFTPVGFNYVFKGTFDGDGYEIRNLNLQETVQDNYVSNYYAMFAETSSTATITNLGLVHPEMRLTNVKSEFSTVGGAAYLVGKNAGAVSNSFIVDDLDATKEKAGISAASSRIATLCVTNTGTLTNNYIAISNVVNVKMEEYSGFGMIAYESTGTITGNYFFNNAISNVNGNNITFKNKSAYNITGDGNGDGTVYGTWCSSKTALIEALDNAGWRIKADYGDYQNFVGFDYGVRRGVDYNNTTKTFTITNAKDFVYMYELFNSDDKLASNEVTYNITGDIDLNHIPASVYSYNKGIGATIKGISLGNEAGTPTLINGKKTNYPTIYNADIINSSRIAKNVGAECYGLFNFVTGTIKDLNIVPKAMNINDVYTTTEENAIVGVGAKAIGVVAGYVEKGVIDNVHVYATITNGTKNIGEYYLGGIAGILGGEGVISNCTTGGSITLNAQTNEVQTNSFIKQIAIGGTVGLIENSLGSVYTCLNSANITAKLGTSSLEYSIGGVIGAGYTRNYKDNNNVVHETSKLENNGNIVVSDDSTLSYSKLYVSGVFGRHLGMAHQVSYFTNNGNVTVKANGNETYVSGVTNADIRSVAVTDSGIKASSLVNGENLKVYNASSLVNGGNITVTGSQTNLHYTNVLNINAGNNVVSEVSSLYNLKYNKVFNGNETKTKTTLDSQAISMENLYSFAPILNVIGGTSVYTTKVSHAYNLRDINFTLNTAIASATTFNYTGAILGDYIDYDDIRNEGNLSFSIAKGISNTSTLKVSGLFDTLNNGHTAYNLFNGGNITINEPNTNADNKKLDMYLAGICYQNLSEDDSNEQNPLNAHFDSSLKGTIDTVINDGDITVSSAFLLKDKTINETHSTYTRFVSNIYSGGITYLNKGIISSAYNLGDIKIDAFSTQVNNYEAGGIAYSMDGANAQIRDSANNGDIFIIDLGGKQNNKDSIVNVGGIVARNTTSNINNNQIITYTINYGTLLAFEAQDNKCQNTNINYNNIKSSAGGILGIGICNLVDIINYGNVFGDETTAGITSLVKLSLYNTTSTINLANTLNYGQVKICPEYYANDTSNTNYQTYNTIEKLSYKETPDSYYKRNHAGAIVCVFDFANLNNINIRYLINLNNDVTTVLYNLNTPTNTPNIDTFITTHGRADYFGGNDKPIKYAPLSTTEDEFGNIGVFSSKFVFRKAIDGQIDNSYVTDKYIPDFFQFVKYDKVNQYLLESIGWRSIAYSAAAEDLVKNVTALKALVSESNSTSLLSDAFESDSWISSIDSDLFNSLLETSLESDQLDANLESLLQYVLLDTSATSSYTQSIRITVVEKILEYYKTAGYKNYYEILQTLLYDELLAKVISNDDTNYANIKTLINNIVSTTDLTNVINTYIELLESNSSILNPLFTTYKSYYEDPKINLIETLLNGYDEYTLKLLYESLPYSTDVSNNIKFKLYLEENPTIAKEIYIGLVTYNTLSTNSSYLNWMNKYVKKYNFIDLLSDEKEIDSTYSKSLDTFENITSVKGYKYTSLNGTQGDTTQKITTEASQLKTIQNFETKISTSLNVPHTKNYSELWNIIKSDTSIQNYITNNYFVDFTNPTSGDTSKGIIALATEYNNTYQSNDRSQLSYNIPNSFKNGISINNDYYGNAGYGKDSAIKTRFIYTPDDVVSYRTNYYGPYMNTTGEVYSADNNLTNNNLNYNLGYILNNVDGTQTDSTSRNLVPIFIGIDRTLSADMIAKSNSTSGNSNLYSFYWNDANTSDGTAQNGNFSSNFMWKDPTFVTQIGSNATGFIYALYDSNNELVNDESNYIKYGYNFNPEYVPTVTKDAQTKTYLNGEEVNSLINHTNDSHTYRNYYLTSYCTSSIITGIWYTYSCYNDNGYHVSLHTKVEGTGAFNSQGPYFGVHTTSYIGYTLNDLLKLDGIKTKGRCEKTKNGFNNDLFDEDEINIISEICTALLNDNKELVLKAIAEYASEKTFTSSNSDALNMLITAVQDTNFASETVTSGISSILSLNYSQNQTIANYLAQNYTDSTNYYDLIISSTVENQANFKALLLKLLNEYLTKCKQYANYYDYTRDKVSLFAYEYIKYKYELDNNLNWSDFSNLFDEISDNDLQNIENLFDFSITHKYFDSYIYTNNNVAYTINDFTSYISSDPNYIYDSEYDNVIIGETNYDNANHTGSNISFTTLDWEHGYELDVTFKGNLYLYDGTNLTTYTQNTVDNYTFTNLSKETNYKLYFDKNTEIYEFQLYSKSYDGNGTTQIQDTIKSPFASYYNKVKISGGDVTIATNTNANYGGQYISNQWKDTTSNPAQETPTTQGLVCFHLTKGENITYNSLSLKFNAISNVVNPETTNVTFSAYYGPYTTTAPTNLNNLTLINSYLLNSYDTFTNNNYYKNDIEIDISDIIPTLNNENLNIYFLIDKVRAPYLDGRPNNNKNFFVTKLYFNYDFDFINGDIATNETNCVFNQAVLNNDTYNANYLSGFTLTNNIENCGFVATANSNISLSGEFSSSNNQYSISSSSNATKISSAITFSPWYFDLSYYRGQILYSNIDLSEIPLTKTLVSNLNQGYYENLSDIAKYIIKDFMIKQNNGINAYNESYIEIKANGKGKILLYQEDTLVTTIDVNNNSYQYYEYINSGSYSYQLEGMIATPVNCNLYELNYALTTDTTFNNKNYYIDQNGTVATPLNSNNGNALYELNETLGTYELTEDLTFDSSKTYYSDNIGLNVANPSNCNLYEANYTLTTDTTFNNKTYYIDQNGTIATPLNSNNGNALYEISNSNYINSTDTSFVSGKTYYLGYVTIDSIYVSPIDLSIDYSSNDGIDLLTYVYDTQTDILIDFDYSELDNYKNLNNQYLTNFNDDFNTSYENYQLFYTIYPYYRNKTGYTIDQLTNQDKIETVMTLLSTIKQDANNPTYYTVFSLLGFYDYVQVTSGTFSENTTYYRINYKEANITSETFVKDGTLYTREGTEGNYVYTPVLTGSFNADKTYFTKYEIADINSSNFVTDGSLYVDPMNIISLIKLISLADYNGINSSLGKLLTYSDFETYYENLLTDFCDLENGINEIKENVIKYIYNIASKNKNSDWGLNIYSAYLGYDYLNSNNNLTSSIMYDILTDFKDGTYQFIVSKTEVDGDKVTLLINYLMGNSNLNIDSYGIYALSSSQGIGYGIFIPDNMDLSILDAPYDADLVLLDYAVTTDTSFISGKTYFTDSNSTIATPLNSNGSNALYEYVNSAYVLTTDTEFVLGKTYYKTNSGTVATPANLSLYTLSTSATWRGGSDVSLGAAGTVDYAFYHDMKQLIQSISTDVFKLNLQNDTIKSVDDQIDTANGVITYYVTSIDNLINSNNELKNDLTISAYELAYNAIIESTTIDKAKAVVKYSSSEKSITIKDAFKVKADDRNVSKSYTIIIIAITPDTDSLTLDVTPSFIPFPYNGGTITATVNCNNLPNGMDLEPFINIKNGNTSYSSSDGYWQLDPSVINNGIVNNHTATITIIIDTTLPGGEETVELNILGQTISDTFTKVKNTEAKITKLRFDGELRTEENGLLTASMSDYILYGRAYNYSELTDYNSSSFYLYDFEYSANANLTVSATYSIDDTATNDHNPTGLMTYVVTFTISSEETGSTGSTKTYTHTLKEKQYFAEGSEYALVYADGTEVKNSVNYDNLPEADKIYNFVDDHKNENENTYHINKDTYIKSTNKWSLTDEMFLHIAFNRADGREPQYRIKYDLSNFYTLGNNIVYGPTTETSNNKTTINNTYAGLTVTVSENNNVGKYTYVYTYTNTGVWTNNETYTRYYEFPELIIEKLASTDALIHELTFLKESVSLGNTATVILPSVPMIPEKIGSTYDNTEKIYKQIFEEKDESGNKLSRDIVVSSKGVEYKNDSDAPSVTDYYAIGTVSDADLSYYCPDFKVNEYAQIYQYTTLKKLKYYGAGNLPNTPEGQSNPKQTEPDAAVLSDTATMYLYVPFTNGTLTKIYLVEVDTSSGEWTNVYTTDFNGYNGDSQLVTTLSGISAKNAKTDVLINDTWTVASYAGEEEDNNSLYMDYIGTPLDGHFWYVSYVVLSEDYISDGPSEGSGNIRHYHISIIDATNNVQFYVKIYTPTTLDLNEVYFTMTENIYKEKDKVATYNSSKQISAFGLKQQGTASSKVYKYGETYDINEDGTIGTDEKDSVDISGYYIYEFKYNLQTLPKGCFYFYLDLPNGYRVLAYTDMENQLSNNDSKITENNVQKNLKDVEDGSFLPYTSIITVKVNLDLIVIPSDIDNANAWAVATEDTYTVMASYEGKTN